LIWLWESACRHVPGLYRSCRGPALIAVKTLWASCIPIWHKLTAPIVAYYRKYK
jgi:hypothetical protein